MKKSIKKNTIKRYSRKTNKIKKIKSKKTKNYKNSKNSKKSRKKMSIKFRKNKKKSRITWKQYGGAVSRQPRAVISFLALTRRLGLTIIGKDKLSGNYTYMDGYWDIIKPDNLSPDTSVRFDIQVVATDRTNSTYEPPTGHKFGGSEAIVLKAYSEKRSENKYSLKFFGNGQILKKYAARIGEVEEIMKDKFEYAKNLYRSNNDLFLNTHYLLTKNIKGQPLKSYCMVADFVEPLMSGPGDMCLNAEQSPGIFSIDKLRFYVLQLARGIAIMHKMEIIHGDIKPGNILNRIDGDRLTPVIIDINVDSLGTHFFLGCEKYMGTSESTGLTKSTDWWAFGITVLLLLRVRIIPKDVKDENVLTWYTEIGTKLCKLAELGELGELEGKYEYFRFIFSMMSDEEDKQLFSNSFEDEGKLKGPTDNVGDGDPSSGRWELVPKKGGAAYVWAVGDGQWESVPDKDPEEYVWVQGDSKWVQKPGNVWVKVLDDQLREGLDTKADTPKYQTINGELVHIFKNIAYLHKSIKSDIGYFKCDSRFKVSNEELDDLFEIAKFATYFLKPDHTRRPFLILDDDEESKLNADTSTPIAQEIQAIIVKLSGK